MTWFTRPLSKPVTVPRQNPASASDELQIIEEEYQRAEKEFFEAGRAVLAYERENPSTDAVMLVGSKAFNRVNALWLNPRLSELCHAREQARLKRNELLSRRASLLHGAGKIR